jgi:hypothetical protein
MKYFLILLCLLPQVVRAAPALEPLQIAEQFVAPNGWAAMKSYLCCEAAQQAKRQTLGQQIPATLQRRCELIQQNARTAVVAVELRDSVSRNDFYLHFSKDSARWKLQAVRSLAMTKLGPPMLEVLTTMPPAEVAQYDQKHPNAGHNFAVGNIKLWIGSDADIVDHFNKYRSDFEQVVQIAQKRNYLSAPDIVAGEQAANRDPEIQALLQKLYISRLTRRDMDCQTCIEFVIGGMVDNTVGLLYQPQAAEVPAMHPDRLIVLKPLGNGWYLYKTN